VRVLMQIGFLVVVTLVIYSPAPELPRLQWLSSVAGTVYLFLQNGITLSSIISAAERRQLIDLAQNDMKARVAARESARDALNKRRRAKAAHTKTGE
jgi:hypothetical protein